MKKYFYDVRLIFSYDADTGIANYIYGAGERAEQGQILYKMSEHLKKKELSNCNKKNKAIPTDLLLAVIQAYPAWTIFDVSLQLQGCRASHTLQWNGKRSLRDLSQVDGSTRMVTLKKFYSGVGFWTINDICTQEEMNA